MSSTATPRRLNDFARLAVVTRGDVIESTHLGDAVIANASGRISHAAGNPDRVAYFRSAEKPLQALAVVQSGAADRFELTEAELSICCASHSGSAMHVATVAGLLEKLGLDETALQCGVHEPGNSVERTRLIRERQAPSPMHNNCSGKHTGMLAAALAMGAPIESYLDRAHPLQQLIARNVSALTGLAPEEFTYGTDGCGAPVIAVPLTAMAVAYARLANPDELADDLRPAARRILAAMSAAPDMVAAPGEFNSELLAAGEGRLVAKGGAEGSFLVGLHDTRRLGLAVKVSDGSGRALPPVIIAALQTVGGLSPTALQRLEPLTRPAVRNCHAREVGAIEAAIEWGDV